MLVMLSSIFYVDHCMVNKDFHNYKWTDVDLLLDKYLDIE